MCTICGHYVQDGKISSTDIYDMLQKMAHRGPDTHGICLDNEIRRGDHISDFSQIVSMKSRIALGHSKTQHCGQTKAHAALLFL